MSRSVRFGAALLAILAASTSAQAERYRLNAQETMTIALPGHIQHERNPTDPRIESSIGKAVEVTRSGDTVTLGGTRYTKRDLTMFDALVLVGVEAFTDPRPFADSKMLSSDFDIDALSTQKIWVAEGSGGASFAALVQDEGGKFLVKVDAADLGGLSWYTFDVYEALGEPINLAALDFSDMNGCVDDAGCGDDPNADQEGLDFSDLGRDEASGADTSMPSLTPAQTERMYDTDHGRFAACAVGLECRREGVTQDAALKMLGGDRDRIVADIERRYR